MHFEFISNYDAGTFVRAMFRRRAEEMGDSGRDFQTGSRLSSEECRY